MVCFFPQLFDRLSARDSSLSILRENISIASGRKPLHKVRLLDVSSLVYRSIGYLGEQANVGWLPSLFLEDWGSCMGVRDGL